MNDIGFDYNMFWSYRNSLAIALYCHTCNDFTSIPQQKMKKKKREGKNNETEERLMDYLGKLFLEIFTETS